MQWKRILAVTAGLMAAGTIIGGVLGLLAMLGWILIRDAESLRRSVAVLGVAAGFGALAGAVLAPVFAWGLLRTVPLGRAILGTALGTIVGVIIGPLIAPQGLVLGALAGFTTAAVVLRVTAARGTKSLSRGTADRELE